MIAETPARQPIMHARPPARGARRRPKAQRSPRWRLVPALLVAFQLLATLPTPAPALAQTASPPARLMFVDANDAPLPEPPVVFGDGEAIRVVLETDNASLFTASLDHYPGLSVKSYGSTAAGSIVDPGWTINLLETGPKSNILTGSFRVSRGTAAGGLASNTPTLAHPEFGKIYGDGILRVVDGSRIRVEVPTLGVSAEAVWRHSNDAQVLARPANAIIQGFAAILNFTVTDPDLNKATTSVDSHPNLLRVYSDSDPQGEHVFLAEADTTRQPPAQSTNAATFYGSVSFEPAATASPGNGRIGVRTADRVRAEFLDAEDAGGRSNRIRLPAGLGEPFWTFLESTNALISLSQDAFVGVPASAGPSGVFGTVATVVLLDADRGIVNAAQDSVAISVRTSSDATAKTLQLLEVGGASGRFVGDIRLARPSSSGGPPEAQLPAPGPAQVWLRVLPGDLIEATYQDPSNGDGVAASRSASAPFLQAVTGAVKLGSASSTSRITGTQAQNVEVTDSDANRDPTRADRVAVVVRTSSQPQGQEIELWETQESNGVFVGVVSMANGAGNGALRVRDRDLVVAHYYDAWTANGSPGLIESNRVTWRQGTEGIVSLSSPTYARQRPAADCDWGDHAFVTIHDDDQNDPFRLDAVPITFFELENSKPLTLVAHELGPDTGVFQASVAFGSNFPACSAPNRFTPGGPSGARTGSRPLQAEYLDPVAPSAGMLPALKTATAVFHESTGLVRFESETGARVARIAHDAAADQEPRPTSTITPGTFTSVVVYATVQPAISVRSQSCARVTTPLVFNEAPEGSGRWSAPLWVTVDAPTGIGGDACQPNSVSGVPRVRVFNQGASSDTLQLIRNGQPLSTSLSVVRSELGRLQFTPVSEAEGSTAEAFGNESSRRILLSAPDANRNHDAVDTTLIDVFPYGSQATWNTPRLLLAETGPNTAVFVASVGFTSKGGTPGLALEASQFDVGRPLRAVPDSLLCFWDSGNGNMAVGGNPPRTVPAFDPFEPAYLHFGTTCDQVAAGDIRLTSSRAILNFVPRGSTNNPSTTPVYDFYPAGTVVRLVDHDHASPLAFFPPDVAAPGAVHLAYADTDSSGTFTGPDQGYADLDGTFAVSSGDLRLTANAPASVGTFNPFTTVTTSDPDVGRLLLPAQGFLRHADFDGDLTPSAADVFYMERNSADGITGPGDLRLTGALHGQTYDVASVAPPNLHSAVLSRSLIRAASAEDIRVQAGLRWSPSEDASHEAVPQADGLVRVRIVDDDVTGRQRESLVADGSAVVGLTRSFRFQYVEALVTLTERTQDNPTGLGSASDGSLTYQVTANGLAHAPIVDANADGTLGCDDLVMSSDATCLSRETDLLQGIVRFACSAGGQTCNFAVTYSYRAVPLPNFAASCSDCDIYHYVQGDGASVRFGQPLPAGTPVAVEYRTTMLPVRLVSLDTRDEETIPFFLPSNPLEGRDYIGDVRAEPMAIPANGAIHVGPASSRGFVRIDAPDPASRYGGSQHVGLNPSGTTQLKAATTGVLTTLGSGVGNLVFGPAVGVEVTDHDADLTPQPDSVNVVARNGANLADRIILVLRETSGSSGVFSGVAPILNEPCSGGCVPSDGHLHLPGASGVIHLEYADQRSPTGPRAVSSVANWRPASTAKVVLSSTPNVVGSGGSLIDAPPHFALRGSESRFFVGLQDVDANQRGDFLDVVEVIARTRDDPGERIRLTETGPNSGVFVSAGVGFESEPVAGNNRLRALQRGPVAERVFVTYEDSQSASGIREILEPATRVNWTRTFDGTLEMDRSVHIGVRSDGNSGSARIATLVIQDPDLNLNARVPDRPPGRVRVGPLTATGSLDVARSVLLAPFETGGNTGIFVARFSFAAADAPVPEGSPTTASATIAQIAVGAAASERTIRAEYVDEIDARGKDSTQTEPVRTTSTWYRLGMGVLSFDQPSYVDYGDEPRLQLVDRDMDKGPMVDNVSIRVRSVADPDGIALVLHETGPATGTFEGVLKLAQASSTADRIHVDSTDRLEAIYQDTSPAAVRTALASIRIGDTRPPVTQLVATPSPDGLRGAFRSVPTLGFSADEPVEATFYRLSPTGTYRPFTAPFTLPEGIHAISFWSKDMAQNLEPANEMQLVVDLTDPKAAVVGVRAAAAPGGGIRLQWQHVGNATDLLEFHDYLVFRDQDVQRPIGNVSGPSFVDTNVRGELPHTYTIRARDYAGRMGPASVPVAARADVSPPRVSRIQANPASFDVRQLPTAGVSLTAQVEDGSLKGVVAALILPNGTRLTETTLSPNAATTLAGNLPVEHVKEPCRCRLVVRAEDEAGNNGTSEIAYLVAGIDRTRPTLQLPTGNATHVRRGVPLRISVIDNVAVGTVHYRLDSGAFRDASPASVDAPEVVLTVPTQDLEAGLHQLLVRAADRSVDDAGAPKPNQVEEVLQFTVVAGEASPSAFLRTTARVQKDGSMLVEWASPPGTGAALGFQVWRGSSPYQLLATLSDSSIRQYVDRSAKEGMTYWYAVSYFTAGSRPPESIAGVPGYEDNATLLDSGPVKPSKDRALPVSWFLWGGIGLLASLAVISMAFSARKRPRLVVVPLAPAGSSPSRSAMREGPTPQPTRTEEAAPLEAAPTLSPQSPPPESAPTAPSEQATGRLAVRCPACSARFVLERSKKGRIFCPECGLQGSLQGVGS